MKFSLRGNDGGNELKFHAMLNIGILNKSNEHFLDYLSSDFAREVLSKNKMKIHLDAGNSYYNHLNMRETIYSFMNAQQGEATKFVDFDLDINNNFEFYLDEVIASVTDDKFDIDAHSTSKFLFHHFNDLRRDLGEESYKVRHTIISDDQHALENLQSKDWPHFINRLLEVSNDDISSLILLGIDQSQNNRRTENYK